MYSDGYKGGQNFQHVFTPNKLLLATLHQEYWTRLLQSFQSTNTNSFTTDLNRARLARIKLYRLATHTPGDFDTQTVFDYALPPR